jgi:thioredoxin 1
MALELNESNFKAEVLDSPIPVLVDFGAPWCGPCRMMAPVLESLAAKYAGKVKIAKVEVDDNPALASRYGIQSIPAVFLFKAGAVAGQRVGAASPADFSAWIDGLI